MGVKRAGLILADECEELPEESSVNRLFELRFKPEVLGPELVPPSDLVLDWLARGCLAFCCSTKF